ncbi:hypothetical protein J3B02_002904 [Coemansia erecta]|uniref:SAP domain-containing protein n=1 Tax=Coemansia asiatica TaxID=1052880 RepID=A0A9W8CLT9_9FUNG|nr:hypothetical protein LPJ64_001027 [Coemansia asiatica]KAJ2853953.1 hypothetical protein J3B02_002904 [Coemansia erecta]KAJ2886617.1 hypothetical protein FB639_001542 [Coemansia asiatica]
MTELIPSELKVADLRKELLARNLPTTGLKKDLVERLEEALKVSSEPSSPTNNESNGDQIELNPPNELEENADLGAADDIHEDSAADKMEMEHAGIKRKGSHGGEKTEPTGSDATGAPVDGVSQIMDSLYVKNLERPLTVYRFEELLGKHGALKKAWLNSIKTRGYARFNTEQSAKAAFDAINGTKFPPEHGKVLECGLVTAKRMEELISDEETMSETVRNNDLVSVAVEGENCGIKLVNKAGSKHKNANKKQKTEKTEKTLDASAEKGSKAVKTAERSAAIVAAAANAAAQEAREQSKDGVHDGDKIDKSIKIKHDSSTLKTKFEPSIVYRPLTDAEVAAKKATATGAA